MALNAASICIAGHRHLLPDRDARQRQARPPLGRAELPAALAGKADAGEAPEAELRDVPVVALPPELEANLMAPTFEEYWRTCWNVSHPYFFQS